MAVRFRLARRDTQIDLSLFLHRIQDIIAVSVRNLFNADARDSSFGNPVLIPDDLPLPRRSFYVQATYALYFCVKISPT